MKNIVKAKIKEIDQLKNKKLLSLINSLSEKVSKESLDKDKKILYDNLELQSNKINTTLANKSLSENPYQVVTEINKINLNNTFRLIESQNMSLNNYSKKLISYFLVLIDRIHRNYSMKYIYFTLITFFAYEYYTNFYKKIQSIDINELILIYQNNCSNRFSYESSIPIFDNHSNITDAINNYHKLFLIGESGIGKTLSIKNYSIILSQNKENLVLYFDLNKENYDTNESFESFILSPILENSNINACSNNILNDVLQSLRNYKVVIILDNFSAHSKHLLLKTSDFIEKINAKIITVAKDNEFIELAVNSNFLLKIDEFCVKFIENKPRDKMINYIENRFNNFLMNKIDYSNIEPLDSDKISILYKNFTDINFNFLNNYINSQQSFKEFIDSENQRNTQRINFIKRKYNHSFDTLKILAKSNSNGNWSKIPDKVNRDNLLILEKLNIISLRNSCEFKINNKNTFGLLN